LTDKLPKLSDATLKEDIFIGHQIRGIIDDDLFVNLLKQTEQSAWLRFKAVCLNFIGNVKAENYKKLVEDLLNAYRTMGCSKSLQVHFFTFPLGVPSETGRSERRTWEKFPP
jgi:hypothetical protein